MPFHSIGLIKRERSLIREGRRGGGVYSNCRTTVSPGGVYSSVRPSVRQSVRLAGRADGFAVRRVNVSDSVESKKKKNVT